MEGIGRRGLIEVLPQHLIGGTEENHEKPQSGDAVYRLRSGPGTSRM